MAIKKYDEYIDSQEIWLGNVPSEWTMILLSQLVTQVKNKNTELKEKNLLSLSYGKIKRKSINSNGGLLPESFDGYNIIEANDIVLRLTDLQNDHTSLRVGLATERGIITSAYTTLRPKNPRSAKFLYYLIHSFDICKGFYGMGAGVRQGLNYDEVKKLKLPVPSVDKQEAIANYLDKTIVHIDTIIEEAKATIEEYKSWKASIIYKAVTKGLDPNAEMKDSGVDGISKIPSSWEIVRFIKSNYVRARLGWKGLKAEEYVDKGFPFLSAFNIVNSQIKWDDLNYITQERFDESPEIKLSVGDILLVKDGAGIGKCARVDSLPLGEATVNSSLGVITPNGNIHYRYEYYYFLSPIFQNIISRLRNGMGVPHLTQEAMKEIYLPLPSMDEQIAISDYLDKKIKELDHVIYEKESLIIDLEYYKKSLIYEVVTGKKKVL